VIYHWYARRGRDGSRPSAFTVLPSFPNQSTLNLDKDMSILKLLNKPSRRPSLLSIAILASVALSGSARAAEHGSVLVVLSSEQAIALRDGKTYNGGYYLDELEIPFAQDR
jgi:hypothetical protein